MTAELDREVRRRADGCCEYCRIPETSEIIPYQIDHVIAEQHGGQTLLDNLALACPFCNRYKGPNIAGMDSDTRVLTRLFHPRQDHWDDHFALAMDGLIRGRTAVGRTTIGVLKMNAPESVALRQMLIVEGQISLGKQS